VGCGGVPVILRLTLGVQGDRTLCVLTKVDVAEANGIRSDRIGSIMKGKVFNINALGYYAVIAGAGKGNSETLEDVRRHETDYFRRRLVPASL
jgi:hypothetical protein